MVNARFGDCRDVQWCVSTGFRTHGMCTAYFPSLNFLYPSYLSFANCSVLARSSLASAGKIRANRMQNKLVCFAEVQPEFIKRLQQAVVTDLAHDEVLELAPVGFLAVEVETVLAGFFLGRVEFRCKPQSE